MCEAFTQTKKPLFEMSWSSAGHVLSLAHIRKNMKTKHEICIGILKSAHPEREMNGHPNVGHLMTAGADKHIWQGRQCNVMAFPS